VIRHYLQDVGSTFGVGANGPHDWNEGWEFLYDGGPSRKRFFTFGFGLSPWQTADYADYPAVGRFEGDAFDPETWKPRVPTAAYYEMRDDDAFWAARRVMAFTNDTIKAVVKVGQFSDPKAEQYLADVLIKRRDKIGQAYLTKINPVVDPALDGAGVLTFGNAAAQYGFASPPRGYTATWYAFDNATGESKRFEETTSTEGRMQKPAAAAGGPGTYLRVDIAVDHPQHPNWKQPVQAYFLRQAAGWKLVGLDRHVGQPAPATQSKR
jgi:hypothetical protein